MGKLVLRGFTSLSGNFPGSRSDACLPPPETAEEHTHKLEHESDFASP